MYFRRRDIPELKGLDPEERSRRFKEAEEADPWRVALVLLQFCLLFVMMFVPRLFAADQRLAASGVCLLVCWVLLVLNHTILTNHRVARILRRGNCSKTG